MLSAESDGKVTDVLSERLRKFHRDHANLKRFTKKIELKVVMLDELELPPVPEPCIVCKLIFLRGYSSFGLINIKKPSSNSQL